MWETELLEEQGFLLDARLPEDERPTGAIGHDRPYDPELAVFGSDVPALERLAAAGGGELLEAPVAILDDVEEARVMRSLRTPLLAAALVLYLLGLLLLRLPDHSVGLTVTRPERKGRRWGSRRRSMHPEPPTETKKTEEKAA